MNKSISLHLILFFLFVGNLHTHVLQAASPDAPYNLRCFDKAHPIGIDNKPYFGWYISDADNDEIQTAYQILVAPAESNLLEGKGDLWDSKKVSSRMQNYVYYQGKALSPGTRYYWTVRIWDRDNNVGPYAPPAILDTGLSTSSDWSGAKWIRRDTDAADDYTYFRKTIALPRKDVSRAIVYVTATHDYELYINGDLAGKGPAYHYPQYQYYNSFDITDKLVVDGENLFACLTHWYGGGQGRPAGSRGFLLKAVMEHVDGKVTIVGTDGTWKLSQASAWLTDQPQRNGEGIGHVDKIDARKDIHDWNQPGYDDSAWSRATEIGSPPVEPWTGDLQPDLTRVIEKEIEPASITDLGGGKYVIDFGKIYAGMPEIEFNGGTAGTTVDMHGGYVLDEDGTVSASVNQQTNMNYHFILNGRTAVFKPMVYLGMRYLQVDNSPNHLTHRSVGFIVRHYELDPSRSRFDSSDPMLNEVWHLMKRSLIVGAQESFVDTPTREKGGFLGDSWSQGVAAMTTMGDRVMNLRILNEFLDSQDQYWPDGRLNAVYPNGDGKRDIPDYTQMYLVWAWDYYMQTGNIEFLNVNYQKLKKVADYVDTYKNATTGLIHNLAGGRGPYECGIIDWPAQMRYGYDMSVESRTVVDAYAYADFYAVAKIAGVLGYSNDREAYETKASEMAAAINNRLLNAQGVYVDGLNADGTQSTHTSQHANMFPLAMDFVPSANLSSVASLVRAKKMSVGMVTLRWLPEAIGKAGMGPHLFDLYTNEDWDGWAKTIALGGTVTWESWDANTNNQSMSHPWGAVGLIGIQEYILGIQLLNPQHELVRVKPLDFEGKLKHVSGSLPTDRGDIVVDWRRDETRFLLTVTIPDNVTAHVYVPKCGTSGRIINVDGEEIAGNVQGDYLYIEDIGSGVHVFQREAAGQMQ